MARSEDRGALARAVGRGYSPHQLSRLIDNPLRRLLISPRQLADRLPLKATSRVLELGPGSGYFSTELARRVQHGRLELVDLQAEMLAKAKRRLDGQGFRNVGYIVHDACAAMPFPNQTFDVAALVAVLGEVGERIACLKDVHRTLRVNGFLAVHEHVPDPDRIRFSVLRPLAEPCGFTFRKRWGPAWNYTALFERG